MKKILIVLLSLCCCFAAAQERQKEKVAVYMAGAEPSGAEGAHKVLGGELAKTISGSGKYSAIDRTEAILRQLDTELSFQRSGAVSDEQIMALGRQFGVNYLCIADISAIRGGRSYYLEARLVDVETAEILRTATEGSSLRSGNEMMRAARKIAYELVYTDEINAKLRREEEKRGRVKRIVFYGAVGADVLGAGLLAYGLYEDYNVGKRSESGKFAEAEKSVKSRNAALIAGGALLLTGISIHIFF
jgi:hypothetical protein